jgi:2-dehydro-3-deoxygluconokinase
VTDVVTIGECLISLLAVDIGPMSEATTFRRYAAGAEMNTCVGLARLGHSSSLITRLGGDPQGTTILHALRAEGIDTSHVDVDDAGWTGVMFRERRGIGPSEVSYLRTGSAASKLDSTDVRRAAATIEQATWLHFTGVTPALSRACRDAVRTALDVARAGAVKVSFDVNLRRKLWREDEARSTLTEIAALADVILASLEEAQFLTLKSDPGDAAQALLDLGASRVVLKLGPEGAAVYEKDGLLCRRPAIRVDHPVDVVGAGDAFNAGYLAGDLEGLPLDEVLDVANACGAFAVASEGDLTGLPTRVEVDRLLSTSSDDTIR